MSKFEPCVANPFGQLLGVSPRVTEIMEAVPGGQRAKIAAKLAIANNGNTNIYPELSKIIIAGSKITKFERRRIEAFLPSDLKAIFQTTKNTLLESEKSRALISFIRDNLYGILPNYHTPATTEHAKGFYIGGKLAHIFMDVSVANRQVAVAKKGINFEAFKARAISDFATASLSPAEGKFPENDVSEAVIGTLRPGRDRQLVGKLLSLAEEMKSAPQ